MPENAFLEPRGLVRQMGWHDLDGAQPGSVRKQDGAVGAYLRAVEQRNFKYLVLRTRVGEGPEAGRGG